jgi:cellulose synthase/poly-beta-1,6-N-acetylglucosamine synthase-like glycosyltransferase
MINFLIHLIEFVILLWMSFNVIYVSFFSICGLFYKRQKPPTGKRLILNRFVLIVPSYKNDQVILDSIAKNIDQNYPSDKFKLFVIADSLQPETIEKLLAWPISVLPVSFDESTKAKALNKALSVLPDNIFDYAVVLDIDNVMGENFLHHLNVRLQNREEVIQGYRTAKNADTDFAVLDGISEQINNHIFRKGHVAIKLSSTLAGSAMAIRMDVFRTAMKHIHTAVEDKELEFYFMNNNMKVLYEPNAIVYDEKVQDSSVFLTQRTRWVASHYLNFRAILSKGLKNFFLHRNADFLDKALQRLILPRVLIIGFSFLLSFLYFIPLFKFGPIFFYLFMLCSFSYLLAIPSRFVDKKLIHAILKLPYAFLLMILAYFKINNSIKIFSHTHHSFDSTTSNKVEQLNKFSEQMQGELLPMLND